MARHCGAGAAYRFNGDIDDVMIFDRALSAEEISVVANGPVGLAYDNAGNTTQDERAYEYEYDYENRIVKITRDPGQTAVAEFAYDALGRRIRKIDSIADETTVYCYNDKWSALGGCWRTALDVARGTFTYGNGASPPWGGDETR